MHLRGLINEIYVARSVWTRQLFKKSASFCPKQLEVCIETFAPSFLEGRVGKAQWLRDPGKGGPLGGGVGIKDNVHVALFTLGRVVLSPFPCGRECDGSVQSGKCCAGGVVMGLPPGAAGMGEPGAEGPELRGQNLKVE